MPPLTFTKSYITAEFVCITATQLLKKYLIY